MKRIGIVKNVNDPDKLGRIQVEIIPELKGITDYPWVYPVQRFNQADNYELNIPQVDSFILVEINDTFTEFYYDNERPFDKPKNIDKAYDFLSNASSLKYPNPNILKYFGKEKESLFYLDEISGEMGIVFENKNYIVYKDGTLYYGSKNKKFITYNNDGTFTLESEKGSKIESDSSGNVIINGHLKVTV